MGGVMTVPEPQIEPVFMPITEQLEVYSQRIQQLPRYSFLLRPALSEGEISTKVHRIHIRDIDRDQFPPRELMEQLRATLAAKHGTPVHVLPAEQEKRLLPTPYRPAPAQTQRAGGTHHSSTTSPGTAPDRVETDATPANANTRHQRRRRIS